MPVSRRKQERRKDENGTPWAVGSLIGRVIELPVFDQLRDVRQEL